MNEDGTTNYNMIGYDATSVYLVTKKRVFDEDGRKAVAKGYDVVHEALQNIPPEGIESLEAYLTDVITEKIDNDKARDIALSFFKKTCNKIRDKIDLSQVTGEKLIKIVRQIDSGIQQALIEYDFLRE
jgi:glycerol-3-phosphate cytidylyltransferase-like family protein